MTLRTGKSALPPNSFHIKARPRPPKLYHLRLLSNPVSWSNIQGIQNAIVKSYQHHHHKRRRVLPPTILSFCFQPVFTYGRKEARPSERDRWFLERYFHTREIVPKIRLARHRDTGWLYHGPGQI